MMEIQKGKDNPILREKSKRVSKIDGAIKKMVKKMIEIMDKENGVGLAAPQVGENIRLILVRLNNSSKNELLIPMINPEIIAHTEEIEIKEEGCLSLPKMYLKIERFLGIRVKYTSLQGEAVTLDLSGLNARVIQHEIDHLEGVLIIDKALADEEMMV